MATAAGERAHGTRGRYVHGPGPAAELAEEAADVMAQGHTIDQAAERLGVTRSAIEHATARAREAAEREHSAQRARFAAVSVAAVPASGYEAEAGGASGGVSLRDRSRCGRVA